MPSDLVSESSILQSWPHSQLGAQPHSFTSTRLHFLDDYIPVKPLGYGATGVVFLAVHRDSNTPFAVKAFSKKEHDSFERAENEKDVLSKLDHPFLPSLHSCFDDGEHIFLVLDYCAGGDLHVLRHMQPEEKFSEAAVRFYAAEIVLGLEHLHQTGIIYRDLKPENILVSSSGHAMLTDFDLSFKSSPKTPVHLSVEEERETPNHVGCTFGGLGRKIRLKTPERHKGKHTRSSTHRVTPVAEESGSSMERSYSFVGTEEYIAPEIILGTGHEFAVDWWALGVLLYEMLYGKTPFKGPNRKETFVNILNKEPEFRGPWNPLQDLIRRLLAKEPQERLGYKIGADEVKAHLFFQGVKWDALQHVLRPPFVPGPISDEGNDFSCGNGVLDLNEHLVKVECARAEKRSRGKRSSK